MVLKVLHSVASAQVVSDLWFCEVLGTYCTNWATSKSPGRGRGCTLSVFSWQPYRLKGVCEDVVAIRPLGERLPCPIRSSRLQAFPKPHDTRLRVHRASLSMMSLLPRKVAAQMSGRVPPTMNSQRKNDSGNTRDKVKKRVNNVVNK